MHETSIVQSLLELIHEQLADQPPVRVSAVCLCVGRLSGVALEALRFAFDAATTDPPFTGARLEIEESTGRELELLSLEVVDLPEEHDAHVDHAASPSNRAGARESAEAE